MSSRITLRTFAFAAIVIAMIACTNVAQADCCNQVTINNTSGCTFTVHALINGVASVNWTVAPGVNVFPFSQCFTVDMDVTDMCGNVIPFPGTAGPCIDVLFAGTCCVNICQTSICTWDATVGNCVQC